MEYTLGITVIILVWYLVQNYLFTKQKNKVLWSTLIFVCALMYVLLNSPFRIARILDEIKHLLI